MEDQLPKEFGSLLLACRRILASELAQCPPNGDPTPFGVVPNLDQFEVLTFRGMADEAKQFASDLLAAVARELGAEQVAFVAAAWMSTQLEQRPSQAGDRVEVVMIMLESRHRIAQVMFPLSRSANAAPVLTAPILRVIEIGGDEVFSGRFLRLLDRKDFSDEVLQAAREFVAPWRQTRH